MLLIPSPRATSFLHQAQSCCSKSKDIRDLVLGWMAPGREISFFKSEEHKKPTALCGLFNNGNPEAFVEIDIEKAISKIPNYQPLNEDKFPHADSDKISANQEWFEARDQRLRIKFKRQFQITVAPLTAITELILSYVNSSFGMVKVSYGKKLDGIIEPHLELELALLHGTTMNCPMLIENIIFMLPKAKTKKS